VIDRILAVVGGELITLSDVTAAVKLGLVPAPRAGGDVVRVALGPRKDGRLRGEITMEKAWTTADLRSSSGPAGSVCLQLYTNRVPGEDT
jgi:hypothetical protein